MIKYKSKKFYHRILTVLIILTVLLIGNKKTILAQKIGVDIQTIQNRKTDFKILKKNINTGATYDILLVNKDKIYQNLKDIDVSFQPNEFIPNATDYMVGAYAQQDGGQMKQASTGINDSGNYSNMYLLFRLNESDYLLIGVASWRSFLCKVLIKNGVVHIIGDGDNKLVHPREEINFEKVVVLKNKSWQDALYQYANIVAQENDIHAAPDINWKGWSTWDFYTQNFKANDVDENITALKALRVQPNIIQIDGGWWKERGDYLEARDNLPGGIKAIVEKIHNNGYKAGLHFDGFRASPKSKIVKEHPEYFIHTSNGDLLNKNSLVYWDYSNPGARTHIRTIMKNARENWKIDYFKIDFMRQGLYQGISYLPVTNVERFRMGIEAMKEGIGKEAYFLACSANFGTVLGLVDAMRVGSDIQPDYQAVMSRVAHTSASFYFEKKLCNVDPDYLVLRSEEENDPLQRKKPSLTYNQAAMWNNYISIFGNVRLESDNINLLKPEKKKLIQRSFKMPFFSQVIPIDFWDHYKAKIDAPRFFLAKTDEGEICIGLFNWDKSDAKFSVSGFIENSTVQEFENDRQIKILDGKFSILLKGVNSILFKYNGNETFDQLREQLKLAYNISEG